jgi:hypothetical protein
MEGRRLHFLNMIKVVAFAGNDNGSECRWPKRQRWMEYLSLALPTIPIQDDKNILETSDEIKRGIPLIYCYFETRRPICIQFPVGLIQLE